MDASSYVAIHYAPPWHKMPSEGASTPSLTNAQLDQNSVFFNLSDEGTSLKFLREVMRGNVLNLLTSNGSLIERYSLAGSSASILALSECVDALE
jgi:hypothetical protein